MPEIIHFATAAKDKPRAKKSKRKKSVPSVLVEIGPHERMTVQETLGQVMRENPKEVVVLFEDEHGNFQLRSSKIDRRGALWLIERARHYVMTTS